MSKISLRRLLSKLTALALSTSAVGPAAADTTDATSAACDDLDLDSDLPIDPEHIDAVDAAAALGRSLALALGGMRPLSATQIAATWALSEDSVRRLAVAHALEWAFPLVGDAVMIDHLSRDPNPQIRVAAARAAWIRRAAGGDLDVLQRLAEDPDPGVRAVALRAHS